MKGLQFYDSDEASQTNPNGKAHELGAKVLFQAYVSLIHTFKSVQEFLLRGEVKSEADLNGMSYALFSKTFASRAGAEI